MKNISGTINKKPTKQKIPRPVVYVSNNLNSFPHILSPPSLSLVVSSSCVCTHFSFFFWYLPFVCNSIFARLLLFPCVCISFSSAFRYYFAYPMTDCTRTSIFARKIHIIYGDLRFGKVAHTLSRICMSLDAVVRHLTWMQMKKKIKICHKK